jgi:hypothetical protein
MNISVLGLRKYEVVSLITISTKITQSPMQIKNEKRKMK